MKMWIFLCKLSSKLPSLTVIKPDFYVYLLKIHIFTAKIYSSKIFYDKNVIIILINLFYTLAAYLYVLK